MARTCSECTFLDLCKEDYGKYWCDNTWKHEWHYACDSACYEFCEAYSRSYSEAKAAKEHSEKVLSDSSSGCYITTMVCDILGMSDNNPYLQILRAFRKHKLQRDEKYRDLLVEYDIVGPMIAEKINKDEHRIQIAKNFFSMGIKKVVELIVSNEEEKAIDLYKSMTSILKEGYGIDKNITTLEVESADIEKSGHGRYIKKRV